MADLEDDFERMELDYTAKCRGPSSKNFNINRNELEEKLKKTLEERIKIYKLWCYLMLVVNLIFLIFWAYGLLSDQLFTTATATAIAVSSFFYITNPLLKEKLDWWFIGDAVFENSAIFCEAFGAHVVSLSDRLVDWGAHIIKWLSEMTLG